ncbi:glycosyltransferase family 2 protein [Hydrogenophaga sp.]|uniref:glycosyltransferase family 2 protein n=1 Tax=Hydrogenophaga sp. TaxID=1904254 RepID=UPI002727821C|nr:glycosyltransferase family 2 protein [Hydrogenophaga sp.]MDO8903944.1 glycosyltransferase family 2 protein [Hydrogenophaga sp.]
MIESPANRLCVGILTLNEERRIARCIESASFADQIVVIDSGSTDATRDIASRMGAEVHMLPDWQGFAVQRNRMLPLVRCDYFFFLDADEVITDELRREIQQAVASGENAAWKVYWDQVAFGKALSRMAKTAGGVKRLFRTHNVLEFKGVVHEYAQLRDETVPMHVFKGRLLHFSRDTVYESLLKLAQYAQLGARRREQAGKRGGIWRGLGSAATNFVRFYVLRRGFLCGPQGFLFCLVVALECFFRYAILEYDPPQEDTAVVKR